MAIVQISRITHRKGLSENLPQLAGAEFGWVIDERRLFIGNGTLQEGAPAIGNTEILTQYSDIFAIAGTYTYKGEAGGYTVVTGPTVGDNVQRTLQAKLDDMASVKDFGATGDGETDDTEAINRALYQLFCREINPQIRRSLFFPAGVYRTTDPINIPPYAKLVGEGADSSIIQLGVAADSTVVADCVAQTADSLQQIGINIGNNGAIAPRNIEIYGMTFQTDEEVDVFIVNNATQVLFQSVNFIGPYDEDYIYNNPGAVTTADLRAVRFGSSESYVTSFVNFDACRFSGSSYALNEDNQLQAITIQNSKLDTFYQGVLLGTGTPVNGGAVGFRMMHNLFDSIGQEGIVFGDVSTNMSGYNIFLDVGNDFQGLGSPASSVIVFNADNNVSVGDMFERNEADNAIEPRFDLNGYKVFALDKGESYKFGTYTRRVGEASYLDLTNVAATCATIPVAQAGGFTLEYRFKDDLTLVNRVGKFTVLTDSNSQGLVSFTEDYSENGDSELTFSLVESGSNVLLQYVLPTGGSATGGTMKYSISYLE